MYRSNPFERVYKECNNPDMKDKYENMPTFPICLDIELTNKCNMACAMCPTGNKTAKRATGFMDRKLYHDILSEIVEYKTPLRFIRWGEPLLHPMIGLFIEEAAERGIITHINTNGILLDDYNTDWMVKVPLTSLKVSFQGVDAIEYSQYRLGGNFYETVEALKLIYKKRGDNMYPFIQVGTTVNKIKKHMIKNFTEKMLKKCDSVYVGKTMNLTKPIKSMHYCSCPEVFTKLSVNWDGTVSACCGDYDNLMLVGDLRKQSLSDIWHSKDLEEIRIDLMNNNHNKYYLCSRCARPKNFEVKGYKHGS